MNGFDPIGRVFEVQPNGTLRKYVVYAPPKFREEVVRLTQSKAERILAGLTERKKPTQMALRERNRTPQGKRKVR